MVVGKSNLRVVGVPPVCGAKLVDGDGLAPALISQMRNE